MSQSRRDLPCPNILVQNGDINPTLLQQFTHPSLPHFSWSTWKLIADQVLDAGKHVRASLHVFFFPLLLFLLCASQPVPPQTRSEQKRAEMWESNVRHFSSCFAFAQGQALSTKSKQFADESLQYFVKLRMARYTAHPMIYVDNLKQMWDSSTDIYLFVLFNSVLVFFLFYFTQAADRPRVAGPDLGDVHHTATVLFTSWQRRREGHGDAARPT